MPVKAQKLDYPSPCVKEGRCDAMWHTHSDTHTHTHYYILSQTISNPNLFTGGTRFLLGAPLLFGSVDILVSKKLYKLIQITLASKVSNHGHSHLGFHFRGAVRISRPAGRRSLFVCCIQQFKERKFCPPSLFWWLFLGTPTLFDTK